MDTASEGSSKQASSSASTEFSGSVKKLYTPDPGAPMWPVDTRVENTWVRPSGAARMNSVGTELRIRLKWIIEFWFRSS